MKIRLEEDLFDDELNESRDYDGEMASIIDNAIDECFALAQHRLGIDSGDLPFDAELDLREARDSLLDSIKKCLYIQKGL